MASVTGVTPEYANAIEAASIVGVTLTDRGSLIVESKEGEQYNLGALSTEGLDPPIPSIVTIGSFDSEVEDVIVPRWFDPTIEFPTGPYLPTSESVPGAITDNILSMSWSPDGRYFALTSNANSRLYIVKVREWPPPGESKFVAMATPGSLPAGSITGSAWSPDGSYLAIAHVSSPYVSIYQRVGDVLTKLADPSVLPTAAAHDVSWSPNGRYLAVAHDASPFMTIYDLFAPGGNAYEFTKMANPSVLPNGAGQKVKWSPNGKTLAVSSSVSPYLKVYDLVSGAFIDKTSTYLTSPPASLPNDIKWSPDNRYLSVGLAVAPYLLAYQASENWGLETIVPDPDAVSIKGIAWSPDARLIHITYDDMATAQKYTAVYEVGADISYIANAAFLVGPGLRTRAAWSPDGRYLVVGANSTSGQASVIWTAPAGLYGAKISKLTVSD